VRIGQEYFGEWSLRRFAPLSPPALHLGAEKLLLIAQRNENPNHLGRSQAAAVCPYPFARGQGRAGYRLDTLVHGQHLADHERCSAFKSQRRAAWQAVRQRTISPAGARRTTLLISRAEDIRGHRAAPPRNEVPDEACRRDAQARGRRCKPAAAAKLLKLPAFRTRLLPAKLIDLGVRGRGSAAHR